jgi:hypothetical protein
MASDTGREKWLMNALDLELILCTTAIFVRRAVSLHFEVFSAVKCQHRSASPRMMQWPSWSFRSPDNEITFPVKGSVWGRYAVFCVCLYPSGHALVLDMHKT